MTASRVQKLGTHLHRGTLRRLVAHSHSGADVRGVGLALGLDDAIDRQASDARMQFNGRDRELEGGSTHLEIGEVLHDPRPWTEDCLVLHDAYVNAPKPDRAIGPQVVSVEHRGTTVARVANIVCLVLALEAKTTGRAEHDACLHHIPLQRAALLSDHVYQHPRHPSRLGPVDVEIGMNGVDFLVCRLGGITVPETF